MRHVVYNIADPLTWTCWGTVAGVGAAGALLAHRYRAGVRKQAGRDRASLAGVIAGLLIVATPASLWRPLTSGSSWVRVAGVVVLVVATVGTVWARGALGSMWSSAVLAKDGHQLRTSGPYRITRHPIYTGILGMLAGTALTQGLGRWATLPIAVTIVLVAKLRAEERLLGEEFRREYERYRHEVPQLIPRPQLRGGKPS